MISILEQTLIIFILLILDLLQESSGQKPLIRPKASEVFINAGDTIEFECIDTREIFFFFPEYHKEDGQKTISSQAEPSESEANGEHIYKFSRHNAAPTDTGWYGCADHDVTDIPEANYHSNDTETSSIENYKKTVISEIYNDPEVNWIYFYVASSNSSFVEEDEMRTITGIENYTAIVPCRPTSPDLEVVLYNEDKGEVVQIGENISYDPKLGFKFSKCTEEDTGHFTCNMTKNGVEYKTSYHLQVRPLAYILTAGLDSGISYIEPPFRSAFLGAIVYAYPEAQIKWLLPNGDPIKYNASNTLDSKYIVDSYGPNKYMNILNLNISDSGIYQLQVTNDNLNISRNFTLNVSAKPFIHLPQIKRYYAPGQFDIIQSIMYVYVPPNINCTFLKCPHFPSKKNSSLIELTTKLMEINSTTFFSYTEMEFDVSGVFNCTACSLEECSVAVHDVLVSDGTGDISIFKPEEPVVEGDNINITCVVTLYEYTDCIMWTKSSDNVTIEENGNIKVVREKTPYSYHSILNIQKVRKEDENVYTCTAKSIYEYLSTIQYNLLVYEKRGPIFTNSNLQGRDISIDLETERYNNTILMCYVDGMPKPNVAWYKDGVILEKKKQYLFLHEDQELHINFLNESSARYSCRATNRFGTIEDFVNITIKENGLSKGLISTITILLVIILLLIVYFSIRVRREKKLKKELLEAGLMNFEGGLPENLNPDLSINDQVELLPYDKKWEFPREQLKLGKQLGSGAFGVVVKAEAVGICKDEKTTTVAVKMVRSTADSTYVCVLARELKIMVHLGKHLNVVNLLGACTKNILKRELFVIVEYCPFGNLHCYMLRHRASFINQIDPVTGKFDTTIGSDQLVRSPNVNNNDRIQFVELPNTSNISTNSDIKTINYEERYISDSQDDTISTDSCSLSNDSPQPGWRSNYRGDYKDENLKPICSQDLLSWAFQVARGMEYLSQRKVLHGDLAARNVLLTEDNIVKICDFGLAKTMYKDDNYKKKGDEPLPVKWMAIESIRDRVFSIQSDIWSFGIVLWEFFTLAETPYHGMAFEELYQKLTEGYRMEQPVYATSDVYNIMLLCWNANPTLRPSFTELVNYVGDLLEKSVKAHYISFDTSYMDINRKTLEGNIDYLTLMSFPDYVTLSSPISNYAYSLNGENEPESTNSCTNPTNFTNESDIFSFQANVEKSISPGKVDASLSVIKLNEKETDVDVPQEDKSRKELSSKTKTYPPIIVKIPDNYLDMSKQKSDLGRDIVSDQVDTVVILSTRL